ncbi:hypothetical protein [Ruegeria sp. ANG-R]|uniref:hypothetical protein n=1 Tax=Ruegeria sp. ANG-R TaxID=1577903 RepID=UPI00068EE90C|nr:hypothetical protein [Ruegeria sp. ANG-R]
MTNLHTQQGTITLEELPLSVLTASSLADTLAKINRFAGRTPVPWSVAAHSVVVSRLCSDPTEKAWGLLHDAHEAFIGDIITPALEFISQHTDYSYTIKNSTKRAKRSLDRQIRAAWQVARKSGPHEVELFDWVAYQAELSVFFGMAPESDTHGHIERAINLIRELQTSADWRYFRALWADEALHLARLGLVTPPKIET